MRLKRVVAPAILLALFGSAACSDINAPKPLQVRIEANPTTAAVGQTVSFRAIAEGFDIISISVELGDGESESFDFPAFTRAEATFEHVYTAAATYRVIATVTDIGDDKKTGEVVVTVQ